MNMSDIIFTVRENDGLPYIVPLPRYDRLYRLRAFVRRLGRFLDRVLFQ
jgi:hypothetical protein